MELLVQNRKRIVEKNTAEYEIGDVDLFKTLGDEELLLLELHTNKKYYKKRSIVYREGGRNSGIYCILKGILKIYKIGANGKQHIIRFAQKGDIIAYRSLITNELACTSAQAIEDVVLGHILYPHLLSLLQQNWNFTHGIMKMMCKELRESNTIVTDIAQKSVRERTAEILLLLKSEFGVDRQGALQIILTREELANMVGTVTESLIRVMSEFKHEGLLEFPGRKIVFLNAIKLTVVANLSGI